MHKTQAARPHTHPTHLLYSLHKHTPPCVWLQVCDHLDLVYTGPLTVTLATSLEVCDLRVSPLSALLFLFFSPHPEMTLLLRLHHSTLCFFPSSLCLVLSASSPNGHVPD